MKSSNVFFLVTFLLLVFGCKKEPKPELNLSGRWIGMGYQCTNNTYNNEVVEISHNGTELSAIKITGDPCVPAGSTSFVGNFDTESKSGTITWTTGNPSNPGCCSASGTISYEGCTLKATSSTSEVITFTRIANELPVDFDVSNGVPLVAQPNNKTCWAASMTMMLMWKNNASYTIEGALSTIDPYWVAKFYEPAGIDDAEFNLITGMVGMESAAYTPSISGLKQLLQTHGPLWVGLDADLGGDVAQHVLIVTGIHGDGNPDCTYLSINNPSPVGFGKYEVESFSSFMEKIKQVMAVSGVVPIHHW